MSLVEHVFSEIIERNALDLDNLCSFLKSTVVPLSVTSLNIIDKELFQEIKSLVEDEKSTVNFGKTLRNISCVIQDENSFMEHTIDIVYKSPQKLCVVAVDLPYSSIQDKEYRTLREIMDTFSCYVNSLSSYFYELDRIDRFCTVVEPVKPAFKDDYRRILLDDRTWLHVEVTHEGLATNIHLVGQSDVWQEKLQSGLLSWDHDKDIVENVMTVFGITEFPTANNSLNYSVEEIQSKEKPCCGICLCDELPDNTGLPQPLCQNTKCGVYFHRTCLYQWLVACSGSRPPAFGVANGACPTCLQPIACSEKDI